jgi:hypothetical protein
MHACALGTHNLRHRAVMSLVQIFNTQGAMLVPMDSTLTKHSCHRDLGDCFQKDRVVAVRLPYMRTSYFKDNGVEIGSGNNQSAIVSSSYALLVLALQNDPGKRWHGHEIDLVTAVADQVCLPHFSFHQTKHCWKCLQCDCNGS